MAVTELPTVTKRYMPPEYENRAKKLFYDFMEGRLNPSLMDPKDKILLNRWLIYNLSEDERRQYNLVSPEEFDRLYPPEWGAQPAGQPQRGGEGLGEILKEAGRGFISELTLGTVNLPSPRELGGILDPLRIARTVGGMLGVIPWFAPGGPWLRVGSMAARAAGLGPIASIALREGVAGGLHGMARSVVEQTKEDGKVGVGKTLSEGALGAILGAIGGRLLLPRQAAGEMAGHIARRIQAHAKLFADAPAAQAGTLNPIEEAVNTVARELNELAQSVRAQKTTTSQEIRNKFRELLGIDPSKSWYFASPEHAVQFLEKMASEGVKAIPRAIVPRQHAAFLRRPQYAEQVTEVLTKAKEAPPAAAVQQTVTKAAPTTPTTVEDLLARLTSGAQKAAQKAPTSSKGPTKATQRDIEKLIRALTTTEGKTTGRRAAKAATPTPQPEQTAASATEQASPTQAPIETLIKALTGTATQEAPATGTAAVQATPKRVARKAAAQKPAAQPQQAAETPAELAPLVRELFKAEETPAPPPQAGRPKRSKTTTKPTPTKPAEPVIAKETAAAPPAPQKPKSTVLFDKSRGNLRLMVEETTSPEEAVAKGVEFLKKELSKAKTTQFRMSDGSVVKAKVQEIRPDGTISLKIGDKTIETPVVRVLRLKGNKLAPTIDARLVDIVDRYRETVRRTASERVHLRNLMMTDRIGSDGVEKGTASIPPTTTGLITERANGAPVYFKPQGESEFIPAKVVDIAVQKDPANRYSKITVWLKLLDEGGTEKGTKPIRVEFDPSRFSLQDAADPDKNVGMALIYRSDLGEDPVLWVPPQIRAEFRVARRAPKKATVKGGTQGAKATTGQNPRKQR
jgi:hypothetical protein